MKGLPYRISICGKLEIDKFSGQGVTHILSLEDPPTPKETPSWFSGVHQQLHFHDIENLQQAAELKRTAPTTAHVASILKLGTECLGISQLRPTHLLVHCQAGTSRSTAASFALLSQIFGAGCATEAINHIVQLRPRAFPNFLIVKYADQLLGRGGELVMALGPLRITFDQKIDEWVAGLPPKKNLK